MEGNQIHTDWFFTDVSESLSGLIPTDGHDIWAALDRLKDFISQQIRPNLSEMIRPGVPLPSHMALLPDGWLSNGFEVLYGQATRGKLEVWINGEYVSEATLVCAGAVFTDTNVQIGQRVLIEPGAMIKGPVIIGDRTEIRQGAYIRGDCIFGRGCVIGHTTEVKHSVFMDNAKAGHFAYIGDSILGKDVNLGAGTKMANLKLSSGNVKIVLNGQIVDTGRRKLGAILGDRVQAGCNSVTNPGSFLGHDSLVSPNATVKPGIYPPRSVIR